MGRHALARPFLERVVEGGDGLFEARGATLASTERPERGAEVVLRCGQSRRHALARPFRQHLSISGYTLTQRIAAPRGPVVLEASARANRTWSSASAAQSLGELRAAGALVLTDRGIEQPVLREQAIYRVPSPFTGEAGMGLRFNRIINGVFDRGNTATNPVEARVVAEAVMRHAKHMPTCRWAWRRSRSASAGCCWTNWSACGASIAKQRNSSPDRRRSRSLSRTSKTFKATSGMSFSSQSDTARTRRLFGDAIRAAVLRRRRAAPERADQPCQAPVRGFRIDHGRGHRSGAGPGKGCRRAETLSQFRANRTDEHRPAQRARGDSVFEEQVAAALRAEGYDVRPQVGLAGFFIDLAVTDAKYPGRYVWRSLSLVAFGPGPDRLRQAVLEDHGWTIHRIWSTDWFQRPKSNYAGLLPLSRRRKPNWWPAAQRKRKLQIAPCQSKSSPWTGEMPRRSAWSGRFQGGPRPI